MVSGGVGVGSFDDLSKKMCGCTHVDEQAHLLLCMYIFYPNSLPSFLAQIHIKFQCQSKVHAQRRVE